MNERRSHSLSFEALIPGFFSLIIFHCEREWTLGRRQQIPGDAVILITADLAVQWHAVATSQ